MPVLLLNLLLTILAEAPVHLLGLRRRPWPQILLFCVLLNGLTLPLATWAYFSWSLNYWAMEGGVALVEALLLALTWRWAWWRAALLSLSANAASIGLGEWLMWKEWI